MQKRKLCCYAGEKEKWLHFTGLFRRIVVKILYWTVHFTFNTSLNPCIFLQKKLHSSTVDVPLGSNTPMDK